MRALEYRFFCATPIKHCTPAPNNPYFEKKIIKLVFYIYYVLLRTLYLTYAALLGLERIFVYLLSGAHVS